MSINLTFKKVLSNLQFNNLQKNKGYIKSNNNSSNHLANKRQTKPSHHRTLGFSQVTSKTNSFLLYSKLEVKYLAVSTTI